MPAIVLYPHIETPANAPAHLARTPRIRVSALIADYLAYGWSPEEMCRQHDYLTLSEAHAVMGYYFDNQDQIDRELREEVAQSQKERQAAGPSLLAQRLRAEGRL
jgi:uncharacterized protein (DUF433 family)